MPMLRPLTLLILGTGAVTAARSLLHEVWVGTAIGVEGSAIRGDLEMFACKPPNTTFVELAQRHDAPGGALRTRRVRYGT